MFFRESLAETNKESSNLEASAGGLDSHCVSLGFLLGSEEWRRGRLAFATSCLSCHPASPFTPVPNVAAVIAE